MHLEDLVNKLLEKYIGGNNFFNNLDLNIRNNDEYLKYMVDEVIKKEKFDYIIVSGNFGEKFNSYCKKRKIFNDKIILVNGNLRGNNEVIACNKYDIKDKKNILVDDSCYSKTTINKIKEYVKNNEGIFIKTYVFYDGSKEKDNDIISFYRYYDNYKVS